MTEEEKFHLTDDSGVSGTVYFTGFAFNEVIKIFSDYQDTVVKSELNHFVDWAKANYCLSDNKDVYITYK